MEIDNILKACLSHHASDVHIVPNLPPMERVNGALTPVPDEAVLSPEATKALLYTLLTPEEQKIFETELVYELAYHTEVGGFRVSLLHQMHGVAAVFRVIPQRIPSFEEIGLPAVLKQILAASRGLLLVAGATGSGKSTSLAAMIDYINRTRVCSILTIEDPIEFVHTNKRSVINQVQVKRDTPDFATALRAALRQDADVILLGELRDLETMRLALTAVETGHLVLGTIHAYSAPLAVNRFVDVFSTEEKPWVQALFSEVFEAILCQRLIKKSAGGRIPLFELMLATPSIRHFVRQSMSAHIASAIQTGRDKGMLSFELSLNNLVKDQLISPTLANALLAELTTDYEATKKGTNNK